mgnify:CR=1 FL=1
MADSRAEKVRGRGAPTARLLLCAHCVLVLCVSLALQKGWYPGKFIDEIKEKRKSREVDKATVDAALAAAAAAAAAAPAPQTAPDSPTHAAETATDAKVAEDLVAAEPVAPQAADPLGAEAAAVHESQEAEADSAAKSGGW